MTARKSYVPAWRFLTEQTVVTESVPTPVAWHGPEMYALPMNISARPDMTVSLEAVATSVMSDAFFPTTMLPSSSFIVVIGALVEMTSCSVSSPSPEESALAW